MRYGIRGTGYAVCCTQCEVWVMCLEIWINIFNCGIKEGPYQDRPPLCPFRL